MNFNFLFPVLFLFSFLVVSCEADIDLQNVSNDVSLHPSLIVPIGGASVTLGEIISKNVTSGSILIGDDSEINYVRLDSSEFKLPVMNFLKNSQELNQNLYLAPFGGFIPPNFTLPTIVSDDQVNLGINLNKSGDTVDSVKVKSATISVIVNVSPDLGSINPSDIKFTFVFPNGKIRMLDGSSSIKSFTPIGYGMINNIVISDFMMDTSGGKTGIPLEIRVDAKSGALPLTLSPSSAITYKINFTKMDYSVVYGNLKSSFNLSTMFQQEIYLDKYFPNGLLKFANPQVYISAISNIGTYLSLQIDYIKAFQSSNQNFTPIYADFNGKRSMSIDLKRKPAAPGDTINVKLPTLNKDWGSTNLFFETDSRPDMLQYNFSSSVDSLNVLKDKSPSFVTSDAKISVVIKTIIPLNFTKGSYYEFKDSIPNVFVSISKALNEYPYNNVTSTALILNITNGLPVKTTFKFDLVDSVGNLLPTTLEENYVIGAGKVDANGIVQTGKETKQTLQIDVSKDQLATLKKAKTIIYKVRIEGNDVNSNIHFSKLNTFDLKVGLFINGDINSNLGMKTLK